MCTKTTSTQNNFCLITQYRWQYFFFGKFFFNIYSNPFSGLKITEMISPPPRAFLMLFIIMLEKILIRPVNRNIIPKKLHEWRKCLQSVSPITLNSTSSTVITWILILFVWFKLNEQVDINTHVFVWFWTRTIRNNTGSDLILFPDTASILAPAFIELEDPQVWKVIIGVVVHKTNMWFCVRSTVA